ncbi:MAG: NADH-quinone oxidoreductase subunit NuoH [Chloroflexi bacterium]|nr:NADH-quinone oxidoreductase subunit NuoH [Chloroflexota bacterium]
MNPAFLDNSLFRNIYCYLAGSSDSCAERGYDTTLLPAGFEWLAFAITAFLIINIVINAGLGAVVVYIWGERRILGRIQNRTGPNRWGPFGSLTSVADAIKTLFKEDIVPDEADRWLFNLAPILMVFPVLSVLAVIPFGVGTFVVDLNIGILFVIAITSMSGISVVLASWASGNRIAIFAGMRSVAMLISYEIPMALSLIGVLMLAGSMSLGKIVDAQDIPFILVQPLGLFVFLIAAQAETSRTPFDLIEAESELAAGYLNDYSSMKFGIFFLAEFLATIVASMLIVTLFLGGWRGWDPIPSQIWFAGKTVLVLLFIMWMRFSWPRLRVDQILSLAWKGLFELTLINIFVTAILIAIWPDPGITELLIMSAINWVVFFISIWLVSKLLRPGDYTAPAPRTDRPTYPVATDELPDEVAYTGGTTR